MYTLVYGKNYNKSYDYHSVDITLDNSALFENDVFESDIEFEELDGQYIVKEYSRKHESGWTIRAIPSTDYYVWITSFTAEHPIYGKVYSEDLNVSIHSDSKEGMDHFLSHHPLSEFDTYDI